jgi:4-amino-4-deoxy-L-arabinose transferase-like glycosyltransferase
VRIAARPSSWTLLAGAVALVFASLTYRGSVDLDPLARDQASDMTQALKVHEGGAFFDGSRSPLFPLLLSPFASRAPAFFGAARVVAAVLAGLCVLVVYAVASRLLAPPLGVVASLALLPELRFQARRICPEPLVALLLVLAVALVAEAEGRGRRRLRLFAAGLLAGAAWMAKGTVLLAFGALLVWVVWRLRPRLSAALALLLGFAIAGAPLWAVNVRDHGSPFYNASSSHVMWEEHWDIDLDHTSTASLRGWFDTHGPGEALARLGHGLLHQKAVEWVYGFLGLALLAWLLRRRRAAGLASRPPVRAFVSLTVLTCLAWLPPIAWYEPVVASRRFLFPLVALIVPAALALLVGLVPERWARGAHAWAAGWGRRLAAAAALALLACGVAVAASTPTPSEPRGFDTSTLALVRALQAPGLHGARILARPSLTVPADWLLPGDVTLVGVPYAVPDEALPDWARHHADYLLLNPGLLGHRPSAFAGFATWDPKRGVLVGDPPPWLERVPLDLPAPPQAALLRVR